MEVSVTKQTLRQKGFNLICSKLRFFEHWKLKTQIDIKLVWIFASSMFFFLFVFVFCFFFSEPLAYGKIILYFWLGFPPVLVNKMYLLILHYWMKITSAHQSLEWFSNHDRLIVIGKKNWMIFHFLLLVKESKYTDFSTLNF